jgi:hypothetical protein
VYALKELAELEDTPEAAEQRLQELMEQYNMGERPLPCGQQED